MPGCVSRAYESTSLRIYESTVSMCFAPTFDPTTDTHTHMDELPSTGMAKKGETRLREDD